MMTVYRCDACGGHYVDPQPDGLRYFHACPPVENPVYQPDITKAHFDPRTHAPRPDARDENVLPGLHVVDGKYVLMQPDPSDSQRVLHVPVISPSKADGAGRTLVSK
jgi:hypothetical protein